MEVNIKASIERKKNKIIEIKVYTAPTEKEAILIISALNILKRQNKLPPSLIEFVEEEVKKDKFGDKMNRIKRIEDMLNEK